MTPDESAGEVSESSQHRGPLRKDVDFVNEFSTVSETGFDRYEGPFEFRNEAGAKFELTVPVAHLDNEIRQTALMGHEGDAVAVVADGEIVGGGVVVDLTAADDVIYVMIDQYAKGGPA